MKNAIKRIIKILYRNHFSMDGKKSVKNHINLEWWNGKVNLGDYLAVVVCDWMLKRYNLSFDKKTKKTIHLSTIGSIIGFGNYDAVIWGSGILGTGSISVLIKRRLFVKYDIRAVRGPITGDILLSCGYNVGSVYGDPAVLMPLIYKGSKAKKIYKYSLIRHYISSDNKNINNCHEILIQTNDYKFFIDEILKSECVISSSLHGIILAEAYGVPAIFLNDINNDEMKYFDWYFSTGRRTVKIAESIDEALKMEPMELPDLRNMQKNLLDSFPYDLWK